MDEHILIIEDDENFQKTLINLLNKEGYNTLGAKNGLEAIEISKETSFALFVADVRLPGGMDGIETLVKIKEIQPESKSIAIIITGYADQEAPLRAIRLGVSDYIYKPFTAEEFLHSVERNIKNYRLEREKEMYLKTIREFNKELMEMNRELKRAKEEMKSQNQNLEQRMKKKTKELELIYKIGQEISISLNLDEVLKTVVERLTTIFNLEICSILLIDELSGELSIKYAKGLDEEIIKRTKFKMGEPISGWVWQNAKPILVEDIEKEPLFSRRNQEKYYTHSFISVPLTIKDKVIGVINLNNKKSKESFTEDDLEIAKGISVEAAIAIENAKLYADLEAIYLHTILTLTEVIDAKDHYTKTHSEHVTNYAVAIAEEMQLSKNEIEMLQKACQLHDIGKIGIHDYILNKPGKLTEEEWKEIRAHSLKATEMLKPLTFLDGVIELIEQHHERYDGKGYPYRLKAEEIKLGARIIAVADAFDAMTTERPYRKALSKEEAIAELKKNKGNQFDPEVVEVLLRILEKSCQNSI